MKKQDFQRIGVVLKSMLKDEKFRQKIAEARVLELWSEKAGESVANHTKQLFFKNDKLFVEVDSPMLKSDLVMRREQLKNELNENVGFEAVVEIVLL